MTQIAITSYSSQSVTVSYMGLPGNQPSTYGNCMWVWGNDVIPWGTPPLKKIPVNNNSQQGNTVIVGDTPDNYIIGYSVGPEITDICASTLLVSGKPGPSSNVSMALLSVGYDFINIAYDTLAGYSPMQNNNWIGLWQGNASPYTGIPSIASVMISSNSSQGNVAINNLSLLRSTMYSLIYFMDKEQTTAAAIITFTT